MKTRNAKSLFIFLCFSMIFTACNEDDPVVVTNKLEAKAGEDQDVTVNATVTLDGAASKDGNNKPFTVEWTFRNKPVNSNAVIHQHQSLTATFIPDVVGSYVVQLKLLQGDFFKTDVVSINVTTVPPPVEPGPVTLSEDITTDLELDDIFEDPAGPDYIVTSDLIVTAKLTLKPGVVIAFEADKGLKVYPDGILVAKGTSTERVAFTGRVKEKAFWKGLVFFSNSPENELDNIVIEYGGSSAFPDMGGVKANLALAGTETSGAALRISNSTIYESGGYGMYVGGMAQLNHFSGNYFTNNTSSAVYVPASQLHKLDFYSHYTGNNGYDGIEAGGRVNLNEEATWKYFNDGSRYLITDNIYIESGVKVTEGANFEFAADKMIHVIDEGYLDAIGTDFMPIVLTAQHKTQSEFWKGIAFSSRSARNQLRHTFISHAGYSALPGMNLRANIAVTATGKLSVFNCNIEEGLGWGIAADEGSEINEDIITTNIFHNLADGNYKRPFPEPGIATLAGEWVDQWSFQNELYVIDENYYNASSGAWFNGAADPWSMNPQTGVGLKIGEDGNYVWTIAEQSPMTGCVSYSAEYIAGNVQADGNELSFNESFWRSKFYNSCAPEQNADLDVEPGAMVLRFEINQMYDLVTGAAYWELKLINPDNSFFSYYRY